MKKVILIIFTLELIAAVFFFIRFVLLKYDWIQLIIGINFTILTLLTWLQSKLKKDK